MYVARHHRHQTPPVIQDCLTTAIAEVRSDDFENDWVLAGFDGRDNIHLIGTGTGGIEALKANLITWDVCYGLVRTTHTLERAGFVQTDFVKFVWVYWRPEDIPVMRKMKIGVHEGQMKQLFAPYHAELNASEVDDVGEKPLRTLLDSVTMSADKTATRVAPSPARRSAARAHWAHARSLLPAVQLAMAHEFKKVGATDVSFGDPDAFAKAIKNVRSDVNFDDWCLVGYEGKSTLRLVGKGRGGLDALLEATDPTGVNYGLLRVSEKFDLVYHEAYCFITWMPESVPGAVKARINTHQGAVATAFRSHVHCQFQFRAACREDITMTIIRDRVRQVIGSKGTPKKKTSKPRSNKSAPSSNITIVTKAAPATSTAGTASATTRRRSPMRVRTPVRVRSPSVRRAHRPPTPNRASTLPIVSAAAEPKDVAESSAAASSSASGFKPQPQQPAKSSRTFLGLDFGIGDFGASRRSDGGAKETKQMESKGMKQTIRPGMPTTLQEAVDQVKKGGSETDFVVVGWRHGAMGGVGGKQEQQLEIKEMGSGGVSALAECLQAHSVLYGLVRVKESVGGACDKEKFCCVRWAPDTVPVTPKAKTTGASMQGEVTRLFHPYHGDLAASNVADLTSEAVAEKVSRRLKQ